MAAILTIDLGSEGRQRHQLGCHYLSQSKMMVPWTRVLVVKVMGGNWISDNCEGIAEGVC